ncbi:nucleoporin [Babesia ovis]|uniref:Nucleoporin n=1 Tax=Babesia ovis TaxID=5869 RepID=A0A9W5T8R2_BABOV|nr:nucleoporin [Babesia ovis]
MAVPFSFNQPGTNLTGSGGSLFGSSGTTSFNLSGAPTFGSTSSATNPTGSQSYNLTTNTGQPSLFGTSGNTGALGLNQSAVTTGAIPQKFNSRCTIRLLTQHVPQWRGHFDVADVMLNAQEKSMVKVRSMVDRLVELDKQCWQSHDNIKNSLNGISLLHSKLQREVHDRCKRQDTQNMISIKARRLCESLQTNATPRGSKVSAAFRVPNHLHVQLTKELLDKIRSWRQEIHLLQLEVLSLKDIELMQYVSTVKVVQGSHDKRISNIGNRLTKIVSTMDTRLRDRKDLWDGVADETSALKKAFLTAVGLPVRLPVGNTDSISTPCSDSTREIKKQIEYLRKFNTAFQETGNCNIDSSSYNIREMLQKPTPAPAPSQLFGAVTPTGGLFGNTTPTTTGNTGLFGNTTTGLFGQQQSTTGTTSLFGNTATGTTGTTGLFGQQQSGTGTTGMFGSTTTSTTGTTGLFGQQQPSTTGTTSLFGNTTAGTTGLFGNTTPSTTGLFGQQTSTTANTGLFGNTTPTTSATTSTTGLFGQQQSTTGTTGLFGSTTPSNTSTTGMFGQQQSGTATSGLFGNATPSTTGTSGLFGSTTPGTTGTTGLFGQQQPTTGGLFGTASSNSSFGGTSFGQQSGNTFGQQQNTGQQTVSKSTAIVPYNPNPLLR